MGNPRNGAIDTLLHTSDSRGARLAMPILPEDQQIANLGKEEDAVDNLATILLINYVEHGTDAAISAADMFAFESEDRPWVLRFGWIHLDEHSFDLQLLLNLMFGPYGSAMILRPTKLTLDEVENDYLKDRKEFCVEHFWCHQCQLASIFKRERR